ISKALKKLKGEFALNFDVIRKKDTDESDLTYFGPLRGKEFFIKRDECLLDKHAYKTEFYLSFTALTQKKIVKNVRSLLMPELYGRESHNIDLKNFTDSVNDLILGFETDFKLKPLAFIKDDEGKIKGHEAVNFLRECIIGDRVNLNIISDDFYLDRLLSAYDFEPGFTPKIDTRYVAVSSVDGFPEAVSSCILKPLNSLDFEYRFSSRYIGKSYARSVIEVTQLRNMWKQKVLGFVNQFTGKKDAVINENAKQCADDYLKLSKDIELGINTLGAYNATVLMFSSDMSTLEKQCKELSSTVENCGFSLRVETVNATDAYIGSLPGHTEENLRRVLFSNEITANLLPLSAPFHGDKYSNNPYFIKNGIKAPCLMTVRLEDNSKGYLNLHIDDRASTLVAGPPGSGKSVLLGALMVSLLRYEDMSIFAFDKGGSFDALSKALGGVQINLYGESQVRFCPLADIDNEESLKHAKDFLVSLLTYRNFPVNASHLTALEETLKLFKQFKKNGRSLSDFVSIVQDPKLKEVLETYTDGNDNSSMLDDFKNPPMLSPLTVFELGEFLEKRDDEIYPVLSCIFTLIKSAVEKQRASAIVIDEAWLMLKNKVFADEIVKWLKTLRKLNTTVIMATQSLNDFERSNVTADILDCIKTRIYLPNQDATTKNLLPFYKMMDLNDKEIMKISKGVAKKDYFLKQENNFMPFELVLSRYELSVLSKTFKTESLSNDKNTNDLSVDGIENGKTINRDDLNVCPDKKDDLEI
ncbi:MAG: VirB4 family type IV secretion system protein, partial [Succinivibrio sp.]